MKTKSTGISLFLHQYEYVEKLAKDKFEGKFSQALRYLLDKLMREDLKR